MAQRLPKPKLPGQPSIPPGKRINLNLSESVHRDLVSLARLRQHSMTEIVRLALSLIKILIHEADLGNKVIITSADGRPLKEIVMPS